MSENKQVRVALREIPSVDEILDYHKSLISDAPYLLYTQVIRRTLNEIRQEIRSGVLTKHIKEDTFKRVESSISQLSSPNLNSVINGTGIILHTGLGRAPISKTLYDKALNQIYPYSNLEQNIETGKRGERTFHVDKLINALTGSEASIVVNNNAAAVLLMLNAMSENKEVIISRGEQIEIGGSFRIPDVISKSGCKMVEVGTTNKTHLKDYDNAINKNTGAILVAHTSNYKVIGFTKSVELIDLSILGKKKRIPVLLDLGSGAIADFSKLDLPNEPIVKKYIKSGVDVISFSGDKLIGGPQCGIICGKKKFIKKIHKNPLYRALRCDKLTYAILENTLKSYNTPTDINNNNLTISLFLRNQTKLENFAKNIMKLIPQKIITNFSIQIKKTKVAAGSGSLPLKSFPSIALTFNGIMKATELAKMFRNVSPPIIGYISNNIFHIDLKAIPMDQKQSLVESIVKALK
tara:strand:- start:2222 stop:3616 length:1395 start_codon:yes stop_codon:yes gene_type:complete